MSLIKTLKMEDYAFVEFLSTINQGVNEPQFRTIKLACKALKVTGLNDSEVHKFIDLCGVIVQWNRQGAPSVIHYLLSRVNVDTQILERVRSFVTTEVDLSGNKEVDFILTVADVVGKMDRTCYLRFQELARSKF